MVLQPEVVFFSTAFCFKHLSEVDQCWKNEPGLKMYIFPIKNGDITATYVSLPKGMLVYFCYTK